MRIQTMSARTPQAWVPADRRNAFERLLTDISARFVATPADQVDDQITGALRVLVQFLGVDRSTLFQWSADRQHLENTHGWAIDESERLPLLLAQKDFPWVVGKLLRGEVVSFSNAHELPAEAAVDRASLSRLGPRSNLSLPLVAGTTVLGVLTFGTLHDERQWPAELVERLTTVAQVFAHALHRKKAELDLRAAHAELARLKERLEIDNQYLRQELSAFTDDDAIVAQSAGMKKVLSEIRRVAATDSTVLLYGETGTGKELLAEALHNGSMRKNRLLVRVNCAALPAALIESELFGREKGAYTGALSRQIGRFETADGGTLFLDEIGELPIELQAKLLRVLESGTFERLGSSRPVTVDVRLIAATNRDLEQAVREHRFRQDLYYRLQVFPIHVPPLRERRDDIAPLVWTFVKQFGEQLGKVIETVSRQSMAALKAYPWPGNVRELRNTIERSMILSDGPSLRITLPAVSTSESVDESVLTLEELERRHVLDALERTGWRVSGPKGAAGLLGVKPTTLEYRMKKLGIARKGAPSSPPTA
jgi:transcriptional regulator with GAF, ATPase, and Fis domain